MEKINIYNYKDIHKLKIGKKLDSKYLASYLAGFFEGDGCIYVPSQDVKSHPSLNFTFAIKDESFAIFLKNLFKFGSLCYSAEKTYCIWSINKESDILQILLLINGHLRTPKIIPFATAINYFNNKHNLNIVVLSLNNNTTYLEDGWFSGFSEAEGSFYLSYNKTKNIITGVTPTYQLDVANIYLKESDIYSNDNSIFMNQLADLFKVNLYFTNRKSKNTGTISNSVKFNIAREELYFMLINYFYNFPLQTSKYLDFIDWSTAVFLKFKLRNLNEKIKNNIEQFENLSAGMNNNRTKLNWDHLNYFYDLPNTYPNKDINLKFPKKNNFVL